MVSCSYYVQPLRPSSDVQPNNGRLGGICAVLAVGVDGR